MIPALSFRIKLLGAMLLLVVGITGATLYVSQKKSQEFFKELFTEFFRNQNSAFNDKQQQILDGIKMNCATLVRSVRLQFALPEAVGGESEGLYRQTKSELETRRIIPGTSSETNAFYATFYLFLDTNGEVITPPESFPQLKQFTDQKKLIEQLKKVGRAMREMTDQHVGFVSLESSDGAVRLQQAVFTPVIDTKSDEILGALVLGFPMPDLGEKPQGEYKFKAGIYFQGRIYSQAIPEALRETLARRVGRQTQLSPEPPEDFMERIEGDPNRIFYQALNPDPHFPPAYLVALLSVTKQIVSERDLRGKIFLFGGLGLLGALFLSLLLSHGFSAPIEELVKGTAEIQRGNFEVQVPVRSRDEIGRLTASFNEMAVGLALKEKYRSVLDKVTDKAVAEELMKGAVKLGGEQREISVLFCDIRGFTALTQGMDPAEVIFMLNEHFTPLTRVVKEHRGFVDKFVGDLIMAVFGAPKSHGNDAYDAARCALDMIHVRESLNEKSKYQIKVGIGLATGPALAGNMGSADRLNYTVLGERVNLASRLCSKAGRMEVVIDETTQLRLKDLAVVEPLPELELKGFSARVQAYKLTDLRSTPTQV